MLTIKYRTPDLKCDVKYGKVIKYENTACFKK